MTVTVVDNDSGDGTPAMVEREFPDVTLIRAPGNVGFSAANNIAMRYSWNPYLLVLNPDTRVTEGALERVCEVLDSNAKVGIAGAKLVREDGSLDHAAKRSFPTPVGALAHFTGVGRREDASERLSQYRAPERGDDEAGSVDAVNGAFMMIRRSVARRARGLRRGLLDVHGGPRPLLPLRRRGLGDLVRAFGGRGPREGGHQSGRSATRS